MFGANYLTFEIKPSPEGGLVEGTKAEIRFKDRGIFEFAGVLDKTRERIIYMKRQQAEEEEDGLRTSPFDVLSCPVWPSYQPFIPLPLPVELGQV